MKMSRKLGSLLISGFIAGLVPIGAGPAHAEAGLCTSGHMCLASGYSGTGYPYQFATDDTALNNNDYTNGAQVSDNNLSVRDIIAGTVRACVYRDFSYTGGATGYANYSGSTWVNLSSNQGSSIRSRSVASC